jgi:hypothetical protein
MYTVRKIVDIPIFHRPHALPRITEITVAQTLLSDLDIPIPWLSLMKFPTALASSFSFRLA